MAQEGIDLATLAKILGHDSIRIVERYVHPADEHKMKTRRAPWFGTNLLRSLGPRRLEPKRSTPRGPIERGEFAVLFERTQKPNLPDFHRFRRIQTEARKGRSAVESGNYNKRYGRAGENRTHA
jgi:hypothetical protein